MKNIFQERVDDFGGGYDPLVANWKTERLDGSAGMKGAIGKSTRRSISTTGAPATGFIVRPSATCMHVGGGI